jgi:hypothetical protein
LEQHGADALTGSKARQSLTSLQARRQSAIPNFVDLFRAAFKSPTIIAKSNRRKNGYSTVLLFVVRLGVTRPVGCP